MQKFGKEKRLYKKTEIERLFKTGKTLSNETFSLIWLALDNLSKNPVKCLISVPKKNLPKAAHRNKIKRLVKEIYRKQNSRIEKEIISRNKQLYLGFIYKKKEIESFLILEQKIKLLLHRLIRRI